MGLGYVVYAALGVGYVTYAALDLGLDILLICGNLDKNFRYVEASSSNESVFHLMLPLVGVLVSINQ